MGRVLRDNTYRPGEEPAIPTTARPWNRGNGGTFQWETYWDMVRNQTHVVMRYPRATRHVVYRGRVAPSCCS